MSIFTKLSSKKIYFAIFLFIFLSFIELGLILVELRIQFLEEAFYLLQLYGILFHNIIDTFLYDTYMNMLILVISIYQNPIFWLYYMYIINIYYIYYNIVVILYIYIYIHIYNYFCIKILKNYIKNYNYNYFIQILVILFLFKSILTLLH